MSDLIDRQAAIENIKECAQAAHSNYEWDMEQGYINAIECLEELPSAQPEPQWIPCEERLPYAEYGESDTVLTTCGYRDVEDTSVRWIRLLYVNGGNWCYPTGETYEAKVYAWCPLPEPWEGGEHGTSRTVLSQKPVR